MAEQPTHYDLAQLKADINTFVNERDWDQFHAPKSLATALAVEAAELLEPFTWLNTGTAEELGPDKLKAVSHEMADVLIYLVRLADKLDVDLAEAAQEKLEINRNKYPADKVRGDSRKYSDY